MRDVQLLRTSRVVSGEITRRGAGCLELCKWIQGVVVIKVVVERCLLIVRPILVDTNLELVAAVRFVRSDLHAAASARSGNVLQQALGHWIKTLSWDLEVRENLAVELRTAATDHG